MMKCPKKVSKELYESENSYPICKECPYVSSFGKCPYLQQSPNDFITQLNDAYSGMSEKELREELKIAERELFG